jgi:hypothetical protein
MTDYVDQAIRLIRKWTAENGLELIRAEVRHSSLIYIPQGIKDLKAKFIDGVKWKTYLDCLEPEIIEEKNEKTKLLKQNNLP